MRGVPGGATGTGVTHAGAHRPIRGQVAGRLQTFGIPVHTGTDYTTDLTTVKGKNPVTDRSISSAALSYNGQSSDLLL